MRGVLKTLVIPVWKRRTKGWEYICWTTGWTINLPPVAWFTSACPLWERAGSCFNILLVQDSQGERGFINWPFGNHSILPPSLWVKRSGKERWIQLFTWQGLSGRLCAEAAGPWTLTLLPLKKQGIGWSSSLRDIQLEDALSSQLIGLGARSLLEHQHTC